MSNNIDQSPNETNANDARGKSMHFEEETTMANLDSEQGARARQEVQKVLQALRAGQLDARGDVAGLTGDLRDMVASVNDIAGVLEETINPIANYARTFAQGFVPEGLPGDRKGALGRVFSDLDTGARDLGRLVAELNHMSAEHDKGDIDVIIPDEKFANDFAKVAAGINLMVAGHIAVKKKAMACVSQFGKGNFDAELEQFPGKKAFINDTIEQVRRNFKGLVAELNHMSAEHDRGDIDVVIPVSKFENDFATVATGINSMVGGHIAVKKKAMACVAEFGRGNFEAPLERFPGKKAFINETIEQVRANLNALVADASMLAKAAVEGRLETRADVTKHHGDFRAIVQGVNDTLDSVITPMKNISDAIEALGRNDMSVELSGDYRGDFLAVRNSFDRALEGINRTLYEVVEGVEQVGKASDQLNAASQSMASNSEEQASAVEEVTSSLTQTNSQVQANTENAKAANQLVIGASQTANEGQAKMEQMTEAMNAISSASQNIGKIIKVIDEIAFQTNLLALNAAVEAARAGQHGRGFAVVAQEVRNLAGRSAKAARETADMIEDTVKRVSEGVNIARDTREALDQIVVNVVKVKDLVAEIAVASTEQSRGVSQINIAMSQVGKAAQDGSKQAEELASAATELSSLSGQMRESVRRFKLREKTHANQAFSFEDLSRLPEELVSQLRTLLAAEAKGNAGRSRPAAPAASAAAAGGRRSASELIPLDQDVRGFGSF